MDYRCSFANISSGDQKGHGAVGARFEMSDTPIALHAPGFSKTRGKPGGDNHLAMGSFFTLIINFLR